MISSAVQRSNVIYVYNEKGGVMFTKNGELQGFTSNSVSIKFGNAVYVYNERGGVLFTKNCN